MPNKSLVSLNLNSHQKSMLSRKTSFKMIRMQIYENARKNNKYGELLELPSLNYQRYRTGNSPESRAMKGLLRINKGKKGNSKKRGKGAKQGRKNPREEEIKPEEKVEVEKYGFLNGAKGFQISELKPEKEDSFFKSTVPQAKIVKYLGLFKGMFTKATLKIYYYEALFILEQNYIDLKKTLMMNEVVALAIEIVRKEYFP